MNVRNLRFNEPMPEGMATGFEGMPLQHEWVWAAEEDGIATGVVMAAPCHGLVYVMRLCVPKGANPQTAMALLRACMRDSENRGFRGFFFHIDPTVEIDRRIMILCGKMGIRPLTMPQCLIVGSVAAARKY